MIARAARVPLATATVARRAARDDKLQTRIKLAQRLKAAEL